MRASNFAIAASLLIGATAAAAAQPEPSVELPTGKLTLAQARRQALKNSPNVAQAAARIRAAEAVLAQARASYLPTISAVGSYTAADANTHLEWAPGNRVHDSFRVAEGGFELSWLLFNGFAREATDRAARYEVEGTEQDYEETQRLLLQAVTLAYHRAQLALENMVIAARDREFNEILEDDMRKRWQAGQAPEADFLNFSIRTIRARDQYLAATDAYTIACTVLAQLMALPEAEPTTEFRPVRTDAELPETLPDLQNELAYAVVHRPDLKSLDKRLSSLGQQRKARRGAYAPQVNLVAGTNWEHVTGQGTNDQSNRDNFFGVTARWNLFTGGQRSAAIREVDARIRTVEETIREVRLTVQSEIRQQLSRAETAYKSYLLQKQAVELTARVREHVEKAYRAGVETITRLNEAQTDLVAAQGQAATARIQYLQSLEDLAAATGRLLDVAHQPSKETGD